MIAELYEEGEVEHINGPPIPFMVCFQKGRSVTTQLGIYRVFSHMRSQRRYDTIM